MSVLGIAVVPVVLLIEPDNTVRGTVASVCRDLGIAKVHQAISVAAGEQWLKTGRPQGVVLSMSEGDAALALMERVRAGEFAGGADLPVVTMAHACTQELAEQLKALQVRRLLLHPFKLRDVIETIEQLSPAEGASSAPEAPDARTAAETSPTPDHETAEDAT